MQTTIDESAVEAGGTESNERTGSLSCFKGSLQALKKVNTLSYWINILFFKRRMRGLGSEGRGLEP